MGRHLWQMAQRMARGFRDRKRKPPGPWWQGVLAGLMMACLGWGGVANASDHADPSNLMGPESNITDLFFFPDGDRLVLIFNVRRALSTKPPYDLAPYTYDVNLDLTTPVSFDNPADVARYGGTVSAPAKLHADAKVRIRLNNDAGLDRIEYEGLQNTADIRTSFGVRDDPFNFPRFYGVNAISMVMSIPRNAFPAGQKTFILWGATAKDGMQIDHVGRSIRTQLPRFGFLNTVAPSQQLPALMEQSMRTNDLYNFLRGNTQWWSNALAELMETTFLLRKYDNQPDVMIYTDQFKAGYPNGRLITDDVVAQTCATGDCLLMDLSFIEGGFPRSTKNDKPFLSEFPYLAEPWPEKPPAPAPTRSLTPYIVAAIIVLLLASWAVVQSLRVIFRHLWRVARNIYALATT